MKSKRNQCILMCRCILLFLVCGCLFSCNNHLGETLEGTKENPKTGMPSVGIGRIHNQESEGTEEPQETDPPVEIDDDIVICIDPGHGFDDNGCSSELLGTYKEKDLTLQYAKLLGNAMEQLGYTVIYTHDGSTFPVSAEDNGNRIFSTNERSSYTNTLDVDFFVSLHCDTYQQDTSVCGTRIYHFDTEIKEKQCSEAIANSISASLAKEFPDVRQPIVRSQSYHVIRETYMPACLIEMGFVTNAQDVANLFDETWQQKFIQGVSAGIDGYFATYS